MSATCLEDRFEVLKDIGDGSFGSVALARVRTAGAHIARRGTLVSQCLFIRFPQANPLLGRNQNHEEDIRVFRAVSRAPRSHLPPLLA